ncbi:hypothetical protein PUN28_011881 [Cardiocondyla obscurior]|uniref:Uncharacterized protein n=1 Tax=Cardiocondyla obscurior TaxID=286306 RepID=A0AAW2FJA6_9HYME
MEIENERQLSPCDKETAAQQQPPPHPKLILNIQRNETGHHAVLQEPAETSVKLYPHFWIFEKKKGVLNLFRRVLEFLIVSRRSSAL